MLAIKDTKPPIVEFKQVAVEDRAATIEAGMLKTKNENRVFVSQPGQHQHVVEKNAEEWLAQLKSQCANDQQPRKWYPAFKEMYDDFIAGRETPEQGMPVRSWARLQAADVENFLALKIRTVEDVANMGEEAIKNFGMNARALKQDAIAWLKSGNENATRVVALEAENKRLNETLDQMAQRLASLEEDRPKRGRPARESETN